MNEILSLRVFDQFVYPAPKSLFQKDSFSFPFVAERSEENEHNFLMLIDEEAKQWMIKLEKLLFAQLRKPMSLAGSLENLKLYESVATTLGWNDEQLNAFHQFVIDVPLEGGSGSKNINNPYPLLMKIDGKESLAKEYTFGQDILGAIVINESNISMFFGRSVDNPSGILPAVNVVNRETAGEYLFPNIDLLKVRFVDLSSDGGLTYAQSIDPLEPNTKITFVECSRWFNPKFGNNRQLWLRRPDGIPGSSFQVKPAKSVGYYSFGY